MIVAVDTATVASLATAAGTLVLAVATFSAVRSSNRSARVAEGALQEQRRPVLAQSRLDDPKQKIMFLGGHWVSADGGRAVAELSEGVVYLAISLRNVGSGIAVCQGWTVFVGDDAVTRSSHARLEDYRLQARDLYIPAGDVGMWQGALRNPDDQVRIQLADAIEQRRPLMVELLYSDLVGHERTISRFGLFPMPANDVWLAGLNRHWFLDWEGPRPDTLWQAAGEVIQQDYAAYGARTSAAEMVDDGPGVLDSGPPTEIEPEPG
jgi:hypothetical protein